MNIHGFNVVESDAIPKNQVFAVPPWFGECKIIEGVAFRYRRTETRNGETKTIYSPLTEDELQCFAIINNLA